MKTLLIIALLTATSAVTYAQRESYKSSSKYNSAAGRVSDAKKEKATAEKFNGQRPDEAPKAPASQAPRKAKPEGAQQRVQGPTQNGGRVKNPKTNNGNV